jgi:hypothetical protein
MGQNLEEQTMTNVQPDWSGAPDWANFWAADSDGYAYWYRDEPTYNAKYGGWLRTLGEEPDVSFDLCWPPEGFDNRDIDWASTLRSRP